MSASNPWLKFYPRDWRGDQALRMVSLSARGLWMECLCIMHEARPYGHLVVNGRPVGDDALARMSGVSVEEARSLMDELSEAGVLSWTGEGVAFSRRMVRDQERAAKGRKAVNRRWGKGTDKPQENTSPNRSPTSPPSTQKPEARTEPIGSSGSNEPSEPRPKPPKRRHSYPEAFETFWGEYPTDSNMSKKEAFMVWQRMDEDDQAKAIAALPAFNAYCRANSDYRPVHAVRFLRGERWEGHLKHAQKLAQRVFVRKGSAQWQAWARHNGKPFPTMQRDGVEGWWVDREWPPGHAPAEPLRAVSG